MYRYHADTGFHCKYFGQQRQDVFDNTLDVSGESLFALAQWRHADTALNSEGLRTLKQLTRLALKRHIGDRPLQSRELFKAFSAAVVTSD